MKQALIKKGVVLPVQVPEPTVKPGYLKIRVLYSCVSTGTEMKGIQDSRKSLLKKALDNPQKVKMAIEMFRNKGIKTTANKIASSEEAMKSQGYSISGIIEEIGKGVSGFEIGDLVSGGGQGFAVHAEYVVIPKNLVTKVPQGVSAEYASIGTVGSISLHGVRRIDLKLGEFAVVYGSGLLGLLALQMLTASGVRVACVDINDSRLSTARELGAELSVNARTEDPVLAIQNWTHGYGADAVLYTAATSDNKPLTQSLKMCRRKGRVVIVGVVPLSIDRSDMYKNEIDLLISSSYGPGRYDDKYELEGQDYPYAYVRWTENRNIHEFLRLIGDGSIKIDPLQPTIYSIDEVTKAYADLSDAEHPRFISIIRYPGSEKQSFPMDDKSRMSVPIFPREHTTKEGIIRIGLIGAGNFAAGVLLPIIAASPDKFSLRTIANRNGEKAHKVANQFKAEIATSDYQEVLNDDQIDLVMVCTRHNSHAGIVIEALKKGKHVYVEKPLATTEEELAAIERLYIESSIKTQLFVGFNRRFSAYAREIHGLCSDRQSPLFVRYRMNSGFIPYDSWVHEDGGRIVGEACHIIDLITYLTGSEVVEISTTALSPEKSRYQNTDSRSIALKFADGSVGVIDYFALGNNTLSKENMEVHFDGKSIVMDDYKNLNGYGVKVKSISSKASRKGHDEEWIEVYRAIRSGVAPISVDSLLKTSRASIIASL